jgi:hypothetical protein
MMLTETVYLSEGILVEGQRHKAVVLRAPIVRDSLEIEKESEGKGVVYISLSLLSKSILKIGTTGKDGGFTQEVPREKITVDALGSMNEEDLERLQNAREYLKKKIHWQKAD